MLLAKAILHQHNCLLNHAWCWSFCTLPMRMVPLCYTPLLRQLCRRFLDFCTPNNLKLFHYLCVHLQLENFARFQSLLEKELDSFSILNCVWVWWVANLTYTGADVDVSVTRRVRVALLVAADCSDEHMVDCHRSVVFLMFSFLQQICANEIPRDYTNSYIWAQSGEMGWTFGCLIACKFTSNWLYASFQFFIYWSWVINLRQQCDEDIGVCATRKWKAHTCNGKGISDSHGAPAAIYNTTSIYPSVAVRSVDCHMQTFSCSRRGRTNTYIHS
jgi:hypothetical protein